MTMNLDDTIAALATSPAPGAIAVLRVSGPKTFKIVEQIFRAQSGKSVSEFASHTVHLGHILDRDGAALDQVLMTLFKAPKSYTGEDMAEISCHGGVVLTRKILARLYECGARPAEPGEFTRRAFLNGKLDLLQAEAVLDLIHAKSEKSALAATRQLSGSLSRQFKKLRDDLMEVYAHIEAFLDFPEEELEIFSDPKLMSRFESMRAEMERMIAGFRRGMLMREGATLVLVGKRNAGKSSLFNALLARDRALVSDIPGTTRDTIEEALEIQGWYLRLIDTAGLTHQTSDAVEGLGMERTREWMGAADLYLWVLDGSSEWDHEDDYVLSHLPQNKPVVVLANKSDLPRKLNESKLREKVAARKWVWISAASKEGLSELESEIAAWCESEPHAAESEQLTRLRHLEAVERAAKSLALAEKSLRERMPLEMVVLDLKKSLDEMRELIGEVYGEDLLDVIFSQFCIGK